MQRNKIIKKDEVEDGSNKKKMKQHLQDRFVICFQSNLFMALKLCNKKFVKH